VLVEIQDDVFREVKLITLKLHKQRLNTRLSHPEENEEDTSSDSNVESEDNCRTDDMESSEKSEIKSTWNICQLLD